MEAKQITEALVRHLNRTSSAEFILPNFCYGNNELDVFSLSKAGLVAEYEVKVSRSDYQADFKKEAWDLAPVAGTRRYAMGNKHALLAAGRLLPNKFWFCVPEGLVTGLEVPAYAGLIYVSEPRPGLYSFQVVREPKILHRNKPPEKIYRQIATKCYYRYYDLYSRQQIAAKPKSTRTEAPPAVSYEVKAAQAPEANKNLFNIF